jgi:hypothetical protein
MKQRQPGRGRHAALARSQDMERREAPAPVLEEVPALEGGNEAMAEEGEVEVVPQTAEEFVTPILDQVSAALATEGEVEEGADPVEEAAKTALIPETITKAEAPTEVGVAAKAELEAGLTPGASPRMETSVDPPGFEAKVNQDVMNAVTPAIPATSGIDPALAASAALGAETPVVGLEAFLTTEFETLQAEGGMGEEGAEESTEMANSGEDMSMDSGGGEAAPLESAPMESMADIGSEALSTEAPAEAAPVTEAPTSEASAEAAPATEAPAEASSMESEVEQGGEDEPEAAGEVAAGGYAQAVPEAPSEPDAPADSGGGGGGGGGAAAPADDGGAAAAGALAGAASGGPGVANDSGAVPTSVPAEQAATDAGQSTATAGPTGAEASVDPGEGIGGSAEAASEAVDASEILAGESVTEVMSGFTSAKPSEMAASWSEVGSEVNTKGTEEESAFQEELPEFNAVMKGEDQADAGGAVEAPSGDAGVVNDSPGATPEAAVKETEEAGTYSSGYSASLSYATGEEANSESAGREIGQSITKLPQGDADVDTNPGPPPALPLQGESDPNRVGTKMADGMNEAGTARSDARQKVLDSPGAEQAQPIEINEAYPMEGLSMPDMGESPDVNELVEFQELNISEDVIGGFDTDYSAQMQGNLQAAQAEIDSATVKRDADRDTELAKAQADAETMVTEAQSEQEAVVQEERGKIENQRAETIQAQEKAVKDLEGEARSKQATATSAINQRVSSDQAKIDSEFAKAKSDADSEVKKGEDKAAAEKRKAESEAANKSWWEKACDFVADALASIASVIGGIFDAVRSAVNAIVDGVKALANSIIDAACSFICDAIAAYGSFLQGAIQGLLGDIFPGLADALCSFVDAAVEYVQSKVQELAEGLKEGIAAMCDAVAGAINAILDVYEGLVQGAIALAQAVITGDWGTFLLMAMEAALKLAGISPDEFYALVGKAEDTITFILENPGTFLGNCISAVAQGFGQFSDNFMSHLQTGFVDWLTGQAGDTGITMPATLDLAGVMDIVLQVLGISGDMIREKAVEHLGEENVEKIEFVWGFIESAISGGLDGLWEHVQEYMDGLWDMAIGAIQEWLTQKIIVAAVTKIASMFNPVGAIVQALLTAWNLYTWVRDEISRIMGVVSAVVNGLSDIAMGNIGGAANAVEQSLADLIPTAISLLANILGLGGIGAKVKEIITGIQQTVSDAIDSMIEKVKGMFKSDGKDDDKDKDEESPDEGESKHAVSDPPAGWQGKVTTTVPSTKAVGDDPGHTYHILDDDKTVVATTTPKKIDDSAAAAARSAAGVGNIKYDEASPDTGVFQEKANARLKDKIKPAWEKEYAKLYITDLNDKSKIITTEKDEKGELISTVTVKDTDATNWMQKTENKKSLETDWNSYQTEKKDKATKTAGATFIDWALVSTRETGKAFNAAMGEQERDRQRNDSDAGTLIGHNVPGDKAKRTEYADGGSYGKVQLPTEALAEGHTEYEIKEGTMEPLKDGKGNKIGIKYKTKHSAKGDEKDGFFEVEIDDNNLTTSMSANNIRKKEPGDGRGRNPDKGGASRTGVEADKVNEAKEEHNASHIIADEFQGSPQRTSGNIITTSAHYNQKIETDATMRWAEVEIGNFIEDTSDLPDYANTGGFKDMDLDITIDWGQPNGQKYLQALIKAAIEDADDEEDIDIAEIKKKATAHWDSYLEKHKGTTLQRVVKMTYKVTGRFFTGEDTTKDVVLGPFPIGPDKWLCGETY